MPAKDRTDSETVETDVKAATDAITLRFVAHAVLYTRPKIKVRQILPLSRYRADSHGGMFPVTRMV